MKPVVLTMLISALMMPASIENVSCKESNNFSNLNISSIDVKMVHVGDIDMAYRAFGQGHPLIMIIGSSSTMDLWPPEVLNRLSSSYRVIIFDNRGMGNTTATTGNFSISQFAEDTAGLMDALGIKSAHILGWSIGSFIAQELALNHPEKVDKLVLYAANCGGSQAIQPSEEVLKELTDTTGSPEERGIRLFDLLFPEQWLKDHPTFYKQFPIPKERTSPENIAKQADACGNWAGTYDRLSNITQSTLIITGAEDKVAPTENSLMLAEQIPASWLVRFKGAGHGLMYQYPDGFSKVVANFLEQS
jgi:pimeloyl-ACP methyl ester carboxylesterase